MIELVSTLNPIQIERPPKMIRLLDGWPGVSLVFLWGLSEAALFFVVPDVAISLAAIVKPKQVWRHVLAALAGALMGGMLLFGWSVRSHKQAQAAVMRVPFVRAAMSSKVDAGYRRHGIRAMLLGPLTGTPFKLYAVEAPAFMDLRAFFLAGALARAERFLVVWAAFGFLGFRLRQQFRLSARHLAVVHGSFWVLLYAFYWGRIVLE